MKDKLDPLIDSSNSTLDSNGIRNSAICSVVLTNERAAVVLVTTDCNNFKIKSC